MGMEYRQMSASLIPRSQVCVICVRWFPDRSLLHRQWIQCRFNGSFIAGGGACLVFDFETFWPSCDSVNTNKLLIQIPRPTPRYRAFHCRRHSARGCRPWRAPPLPSRRLPFPRHQSPLPTSPPAASSPPPSSPLIRSALLPLLSLLSALFLGERARRCVISPSLLWLWLISCSSCYLWTDSLSAFFRKGKHLSELAQSRNADTIVQCFDVSLFFFFPLFLWLLY